MELIVVAVGVALVWRLVKNLRSRGQRVSAVPVAAPGEAGVPTFRLVALGPRGAGKTLLLASMHHQLQTPAGRSYFLTAPYEQVLLLNQWFSQVADTGQDWPYGTAMADTREFMFTVRAKAPSGEPHTIMRLGYLEYAGRLLTEPQEEGSTHQSDLLQRVTSAHALLGIIDGYDLRRWIDGHAEGQMRVQHSLTAMISLMLMAPCPISFVITKWDLLADIDPDEDARLQMVRKLLMSNQGFRDLVQTHSAHRVVRLIPVSAVGPVFAALDSDGNVTKLPGGQIYPTNVDVPLAAVVPDLFEQAEHRLDKARLQTALADLRRQSDSPVAALAELGSFVVRTAGGALGVLGSQYAMFVADIAAELFGSRGGGAADRRARNERRIDQVEQAIEEFRLVRRKVVREMQGRLDVLEGRLPASRLSEGY